MFARKTPLFASLLATVGLLSAGTCGATLAPDVWEILESAQPVYAEDNGELIGHDVQLSVRNLSLNGAITAFAVGVSDANVWAYTTREGWQPSGNQGVHHAETWDFDYKQYFGGLTWNDFIAGQTRADGSNYNWFALYFNESGNGISPGESASQFSYFTSLYPASPAAIGVTGGNGLVVGIAGQTTLVPEPETWLLMLAGMALVIGTARRHTRGGHPAVVP